MAAAGFLGAEVHRKNGVIAAQEATIERQLATIEQVSGDRITIEIRNEFKNTAVLGKAVTTASVTNQAEQQAAIIKRELEAWQLQKEPPEVKVPLRAAR